MPLAPGTTQAGSFQHLPIKVYLYVGSLLQPADIHQLMQTCKTIHDIFAAQVYDTLNVDSITACRCLTMLFYCLQLQAAHHICYPPILLFCVLRFRSYSPSTDLHFLMLLCDVLAEARRLCYLEIRIGHELASPLVALLHRFSITRVPTSIATTAFKVHTDTNTPYGTILMLLVLQCIQSTNYKIVSAIAKVGFIHGSPLPHGVTRCD